MMGKVSWNEVVALRGHPARTRALLRDPLSSWLFAPDARQQLGLAAPRLPAEPGQGVVLYAADKSLTSCPVFAAGFGLPFEWRRGATDSPALPLDLRTRADHVRRVLGLPDWGLRLHPALEGPDLSDWPMPSTSAWASLATALLLANLGGRPEPQVFATGAWEDHGLATVEEIAAKVAAVTNLTAQSTAKAQLWVPAANFDEAVRATRELGSRAEIKAFPAGVAKPVEALSACLASLDSPPPSSASLEDRLAYANRPWIVNQFKPRAEYYRNSLVQDLARRMADDDRLRNANYARMAISVGETVGVEALSLLAVRPTDGWRPLASPGSERKLPGLLALTQAASLATPAAPTVVLKGPDSAPDAIRALANWLRDVPPGRKTVVDITAGTKEMTAVLVRAAQLAGADVLYVAHQTVKETNRPNYGKEYFVFCDWIREGASTATGSGGPSRG